MISAHIEVAIPQLHVAWRELRASHEYRVDRVEQVGLCVVLPASLRPRREIEGSRNAEDDERDPEGEAAPREDVERRHPLHYGRGARFFSALTKN